MFNLMSFVPVFHWALLVRWCGCGLQQLTCGGGFLVLSVAKLRVHTDGATTYTSCIVSVTETR